MFQLLFENTCLIYRKKTDHVIQTNIEQYSNLILLTFTVKSISNYFPLTLGDSYWCCIREKKTFFHQHIFTPFHLKIHL